MGYICRAATTLLSALGNVLDISKLLTTRTITVYGTADELSAVLAGHSGKQPGTRTRSIFHVLNHLERHFFLVDMFLTEN